MPQAIVNTSRGRDYSQADINKQLSDSVIYGMVEKMRDREIKKRMALARLNEAGIKATVDGYGIVKAESPKIEEHDLKRDQIYEEKVLPLPDELKNWQKDTIDNAFGGLAVPQDSPEVAALKMQIKEKLGVKLKDDDSTLGVDVDEETTTAPKLETPEEKIKREAIEGTYMDDVVSGTYAEPETKSPNNKSAVDVAKDKIEKGGKNISASERESKSRRESASEGYGVKFNAPTSDEIHLKAKPGYQLETTSQTGFYDENPETERSLARRMNYLDAVNVFSDTQQQNAYRDQYNNRVKRVDEWNKGGKATKTQLVVPEVDVQAKKGIASDITEFDNRRMYSESNSYVTSSGISDKSGNRSSTDKTLTYSLGSRQGEISATGWGIERNGINEKEQGLGWKNWKVGLLKTAKNYNNGDFSKLKITVFENGWDKKNKKATGRTGKSWKEKVSNEEEFDRILEKNRENGHDIRVNYGKDLIYKKLKDGSYGQEYGEAIIEIRQDNSVQFTGSESMIKTIGGDVTLGNEATQGYGSSRDASTKYKNNMTK